MPQCPLMQLVRGARAAPVHCDESPAAEDPEDSTEVLLRALQIMRTRGAPPTLVEAFQHWLQQGTGSEPAERRPEPPPLRAVEWASVVPVPERYARRRAREPETHRRAMTLRQFQEVGELVQEVLDRLEIVDPLSKGRVTWENVNLYHINDLFVTRLTLLKETPSSCSFMELVAAEAQDPLWFVSHWWGTNFKRTLHMMAFHATSRGLDQDAAYWMCTFANNQHDLGELAEPDLMSTPFVNAIMRPSCRGTVVFLDEKATPFKRAWCVLEAVVSTKHGRQTTPQKLLDVAGILEEGFVRHKKSLPTSCIVLQDDGEHNHRDVCEVEGARFPLKCAEEAVAVCIEDADATNPNDKDNILRLILGQADLTAPRPRKHVEYDKVNRVLHELFAPRALFAFAYSNAVAQARRLLEDKLCHPDVPTEDGTTPLHLAAQKNFTEMMELLLKHGANPQFLNKNLASPAFRAGMRNSTEAMRILIREGADINTANHKGYAPIHMAAKYGGLETLQVLLEARADLNLRTKQGETALKLAANDDIRKVLIEAGADGAS